MPEQLKSPVKIALNIGGIFLLLLIGLISVSFRYLDYYEYGFLRQRSTARVFTDKVYKGGRHFVGPDFDFRVYPAAANAVTLKSTAAFTKDKLEVNIAVQFQYFIRPEQLHVLHKKYQLTYHSVIKNSAMDAIKAAANNFTTEQFIKDRSVVEVALEKAVKYRIGGKCCEADCSRDVCFPDCIPLQNCTNEEDMGLMVTMRHFFLSHMTMPTKVYNRYLRALLLVEESQMEKYRLEEAVVKKEVDEAVKSIDNQAREVGENATAQAKLITQRANAESLKIVGSMRSEGLGILMNECGISDEKKKMSIHYLSSLGNNDRAHMAVDFNNFVVGGK